MSAARSPSCPCCRDCRRAIAFRPRLEANGANPIGMARPPFLSFPHHRASGRTPVSRRAMGGRDANDGSPRPSRTNGCVNLVGFGAPPRTRAEAAAGSGSRIRAKNFSLRPLHKSACELHTRTSQKANSRQGRRALATGERREFVLNKTVSVCVLCEIGGGRGWQLFFSLHSAITH